MIDHEGGGGIKMFAHSSIHALMKEVGAWGWGVYRDVSMSMAHCLIKASIFYLPSIFYLLSSIFDRAYSLFYLLSSPLPLTPLANAGFMVAQKSLQSRSKKFPKWCQNRGLEGLGAQRARKPTRTVFLGFQKTKKTQNY